MPTTNKSALSPASHQPSMPNKISTNAIGKAGSVPNVPGATGASPVPKPKPKKHTGRCSSHEKVGLKSAKMIESQRS